MAAEPVIVVDELSFRYVGRKRPALSKVSFAVEAGETLLILGPSGGGKSTLALCLTGLIPHRVAGEQTGHVRVLGIDTGESPVAALTQAVGLVFQDPDAQFCMLRVDDEIAFGLENVRVPAPEMPARVEQALNLVGLAGRERSRIDRLSGGTRQRVALAAVLAMEPRILVFDEPTSNLDPAGAREVFDAIAALKTRGDRTIVIVEHRLDHLMGLVDRVLVLDAAGRVAARGRPVEVLRDRAAALATGGVWIPQVSEVANRLSSLGISSVPFPLTVEGATDTYGEMLSASTTQDRDPSSRHRMTDLADERLNVDAEQHLTPAIAISHLSYTYPGGAVGLYDVSLIVPSGAFLAIVGPNGAGKSTLARHLIGSIRPPAGAVLVQGWDVRATPAARLAQLVGYVFQNPEHQFLARTVFDELAFGLRLRGETENAVRERVDDMLAAFGLSSLARANPFALSHGEKRRLSVATMLILGQDVLVLDEPTFGQDRQNSDALLARLVELNRIGRTIVTITHDSRLVAEYATSVAVMVEGEIDFVGSVDALLANDEALRRAHQAPPPVYELSRRLAAMDATFPPTRTVADFVDALHERLPGRDSRAILPSGGHERVEPGPEPWLPTRRVGR